MLGRFVRDGRPILLLVNVGRSDYAGTLTVSGGGWTAMDPATGAVQAASTTADGRVVVKLKGRQAVVLVGSEDY